jgi:hypothetical protein
LLSGFGCTVQEQNYGCVSCTSAAMRVTFFDGETRSPRVAGATVTVTNSRNESVTYCDTCSSTVYSNVKGDSSYLFPGGPGTYSLHFSHPLYDSFTISNIRVTQWEQVTCEHANTLNMVISVHQRALEKSISGQSYSIMSQYEHGHCM